LDDIAIYTDDKELPLKEVLKRIYQKENANAAIDPKSTNDQLKKYFEGIVPDYDREKVYVSDIKKVITWYNLLLSQNMIDLEEDPKDEKNTEEVKEEGK